MNLDITKEVCFSKVVKLAGIGTATIGATLSSLTSEELINPFLLISAALHQCSPFPFDPYCTVCFTVPTIFYKKASLKQ